MQNWNLTPLDLRLGTAEYILTEIHKHTKGQKIYIRYRNEG